MVQHESVPRPIWHLHQTRATGTTELLHAGLLSIEKRSLAADPRSTTFDIRRTRSMYRLFGEALVTPSPGAGPSFRQAPAVHDLALNPGWPVTETSS